MAVQMYMLTFKGGFNQDASRDVQRHVRQLGGYTLMVTPNGPIVAIDDSMAASVAGHALVDGMGGVTLDPRGRAAKHLEAIFAGNLSRQISMPVAESFAPEPSEGDKYVRRSRPT